MKMIDMFYEELMDAKERKVPLIIPIGTVEYHAYHVSNGCDTMVVTGVLDRLEKTKEIVVAPPIWYGVSSYAVAGPEKGTVHVSADAYEIYITEIFRSLIEGGWTNIYCIFFHQSEGNGLMPMTLSCMKAAKKVLMEYLEKTKGYGWGGRNAMKNYYKNRETAENPLTYIKVIQLLDEESQKRVGGFDHAGKYETSFLSALYPKAVDFSKTKSNIEWFAIPSQEASVELGEKMVSISLEYLDKVIV